MLDTIQGWITLALAHPDATWPIVGSLAGWMIAIIVETWFIDPKMPLLQQKRILVAINIVASWALAVLLWGAMDTDDNLQRRIVVGLVAAVFAPVVYPTIGRIATKLWPSVGSAWAQKVATP